MLRREKQQVKLIQGFQVDAEGHTKNFHKKCRRESEKSEDRKVEIVSMDLKNGICGETRESSKL